MAETQLREAAQVTLHIGVFLLVKEFNVFPSPTGQGIAVITRRFSAWRDIKGHAAL